MCFWLSNHFDKTHSFFMGRDSLHMPEGIKVNKSHNNTRGNFFGYKYDSWVLANQNLYETNLCFFFSC